MRYDLNDEHNIIDVFNKIDDIKSYINALSGTLTGNKKGMGELAKSYLYEHLDELKEMIKNKIV